jgi:Tfp pilus assembly major pilin PilA
MNAAAETLVTAGTIALIGKAIAAARAAYTTRAAATTNNGSNAATKAETTTQQTTNTTRTTTITNTNNAATKTTTQQTTAVSTTSAANRNVTIDPGKLDYLFGGVTSGSHNTARSLGLQLNLESIGILDNAAGRETVTQALKAAVVSDSNILLERMGKYGLEQVRESLIAGPFGILKLESAWQVTENGLRLTTVILYGG